MASVVSAMGIQQTFPPSARVSTNFAHYAEAYRCLSMAVSPVRVVGPDTLQTVRLNTELHQNLHNLEEISAFYERHGLRQGTLSADFPDIRRYRSLQGDFTSDEAWADLVGLDHTLSLLEAALHMSEPVGPVRMEEPDASTPPDATSVERHDASLSSREIITQNRTRSHEEPDSTLLLLFGLIVFVGLTALAVRLLKLRARSSLSEGEFEPLPLPPADSPPAIPIVNIVTIVTIVKRSAVDDFLEKCFPPPSDPTSLYDRLIHRLGNDIMRHCAEHSIGPADNLGSPPEGEMDAVIESTFRDIHQDFDTDLQELILGLERNRKQSQEAETFKRVIGDFFSRFPQMAHATLPSPLIDSIETVGGDVRERLQRALDQNKDLRTRKNRRKLVEIFVANSKEKYVGSVENLDETSVWIVDKEDNNFRFEIKDLLTVRTRRPDSDLTSRYNRVANPQFPDKSVNESGVMGGGMMVLVDYSDPKLVSFLETHIEPIRQRLLSDQMTETDATKDVWKVVSELVAYDQRRLVTGAKNKLYSLSEFLEKSVCNERGMLEQIAYQYLGIQSQFKKGRGWYEGSRHAWVEVYPKNSTGECEESIIADPQMKDLINEKEVKDTEFYKDDGTPFAKQAVSTVMSPAPPTELSRLPVLLQHLKNRWPSLTSLNGVYDAGIQLLGKNIFEIGRERGIKPRKTGLPPEYLMTEILGALFKDLEDKGLTLLASELRKVEEIYQRSTESVILEISSAK